MARSIVILIISLFALNLVISNSIQQQQQQQEQQQQEQSGDSSLVDDELHYASPKITSAQLLRARGYLAKEFRIVTRDNYILYIVRGTNPLISESEQDSKLPILFTHASLVTSRSFLLNSEGIRPRVYNGTTIDDLSKLSVDQLLELVADDEAQKSLPFLAMNMGFPVWLVDRCGFGLSRGMANRPNRTLTDALVSVPGALFGNALGLNGLSAPSQEQNQSPSMDETGSSSSSSGSGSGSGSGSSGDGQLRFNPISTLTKQGLQFPLPFSGPFGQQLQALTKLPTAIDSLAEVRQEFIDTFDPDYWSFSFDKQAEIDMPATIDFVLNQSNKQKLHLVAHSGGAVVALLALAEQPELAQKISRAIIWAPPLNLGSLTDITYPLAFGLSFLQTYRGPIPFLFQTDQIRAALQVACATELAQETVCETLIDTFYGPSGYQAPIRPWFIADSFASTVSGELLHLAQFVRTNVPCKFDYILPSKNRAKYGQARPPCYDLGKITVNDMSLYAGGKDIIVSPEDIQRTVDQLKIPLKYVLIDDAGIFFNHVGYLNHKQANKLVVLPSLLDIAQSQARESQ